jgi:GNAT superfamily N-acetyltransferase
VNEVLIRPAKVTDAGGMAFVHVRSWQETYRGLIPDEFLDNLPVERRAQKWMTTLANPDETYHLTFVAETKGKVMGFANYGRERGGDSEYQGELYAIYLLEEHQGRGIGRSLMQNVGDGLLAMGIESMLVWVLADNPTRTFYERMGAFHMREKQIEIAGVSLKEVAYGWKDRRSQSAEIS